MISEELDAWVLHQRRIGEQRFDVTLFTRQKGLVRAGYAPYGMHRFRTIPALPMFAPLWLTLSQRVDWHDLNQFEVVSPPLLLTGDSLFSGLYVNELVHQGLSPLDRLPDFYATYVHTLQGLVNAADRLAIEVLLRRFEWQWLSVCGYELSLLQDALNAPIQTNNCYAWIAGEGFLLSKTGLEGAHLIAWANNDFSDARVLKTAKWVMRQAIDHALGGKPIHSRCLYRC